jgi:uncharacterized membrane protein
MTCSTLSDEEPPVKLELLAVFGVACLAVFAAFVWLPACLLVLGVACIAIAWLVSADPVDGRDS